MIYSVKSTDSYKRLDAYLHEQMPKYSRSWIQKVIKRGDILVNGKKVRVSYKVRLDDVVTGDISAQDRGNVEPMRDITIDVVHETDHLVFINKPVGLTVHPGDATKEPTLAHGLLARYPEMKGVGESDSRPGIVHRLDRETSGIMVAVRDTETYEDLKKAWMKHRVHKTYIVVVHGVMSDKAGVLESYIRSSTDHDKMVSETQGDGKAATSFYEVVDETQHYSLVKVMPQTGRTHQIRVQFSALGHPVVGDKRYKPKKLKTRDFPRMMLHAYLLEFDLHEEHFVQKAPLPRDYMTMLDALNLSIDKLDQL